MWLRREFHRIGDGLHPSNRPVFNPDDNYFQWFELPVRFEVDTEALAETYRRLQAAIHPDRMAAAEEAEKLQAVQLTSLLNEGYGTLLSPVKRAAYLLKLKGEDVESFDQSELPLELLEEQMELRERLEDLPEGDAALDDLNEMKADAQDRHARNQTRFAEAVQRDELSEARELFHELQFLDKLLKEIDAAEEQRLGY